MSSKSKKVYGIGLNDFDGSISWVEEGKTKTCPIYACWKAMIRRCYSEKLHAAQPTYSECTVSDEWINFKSFRGWAISRFSIGLQLDKDILVEGNKEYSREKCAFISKDLNLFITGSIKSRGEWPTGVFWVDRLGRFKAYCSNPFTGRKEHLGLFDRKEDAHEAWRSRKHDHALRYAEFQTDKMVAESLRVRYLPRGEA